MKRVRAACFLVQRCQSHQRSFSSTGASGKRNPKPPLTRWDDPAVTRAFFESIRAQAQLWRLEDFYTISNKQIIGYGAGSLLSRFNLSLKAALQHAYPEHEWLEWRFSRVHPDFWKHVENQRLFTDWAAKQIGVQKYEDWYHVPIQELNDRGGITMMAKVYNSSMYQALSTIYPEHEWIEWLFQGVPRGFWKKQENTKRYFEWLGPKLGVESLHDWYNYTVNDWEKYSCTAPYFMLSRYGKSHFLAVRKGFGAAGFMGHIYDNSRKKALQCAFPEHDWDAKRFKTFAFETQSLDELRVSVERILAPQVRVETLEDWYRVSWTQIRAAGFSKMLERFGTLFDLLSALYPAHQWDQSRFGTSKIKSSQRMLRLCVEQIFPDREIVEEFFLPSSNQQQRLPMQFDIAVPSLNLVFEFQGSQHYKDAYRFGQSAESSISDLDKAAACSRANYTLIAVPHWWNQSVESLSNTIREHRPDLIPAPVGDGKPIPSSASAS